MNKLEIIFLILFSASLFYFIIKHGGSDGDV